VGGKSTVRDRVLEKGEQGPHTIKQKSGSGTYTEPGSLRAGKKGGPKRWEMDQFLWRGGWERTVKVKDFLEEGQ